VAALFLLLAIVGAIILTSLPLAAGLGYLAVLAWVAYLLQLLFIQKDAVSQALSELRRTDGAQ
jgi:hypothetical protein